MVVKKIKKVEEFSQSNSKAHYNTIEVKIVLLLLLLSRFSRV